MSKPSRTGNRLRRDEIVTAATLVTPRLTAANRSGSDSRAMLAATRGPRLASVLPLPFLPGNAPHRPAGARDLARADKDERIKELRRPLRGPCRQDIPINNHAPAAMRTMPARGAAPRAGFRSCLGI